MTREIARRPSNWDGVLEPQMETIADPNNYFIKQDRRLVYPYFTAYASGDPAEKVDIVILPHGYTNEEMGLFVSDCKKFTDGLFQFAPYNQQKAGWQKLPLDVGLYHSREYQKFYQMIFRQSSGS